MLRTQPNTWLHGVATLSVIGWGGYAALDAVEWLLIGLAIVLVWIAETFNTAIEVLGDAISDEYHEGIKAAKDLGALATLISAVYSVVVGVVVFGPRLLAWIG